MRKLPRGDRGLLEAAGNPRFHAEPVIEGHDANFREVCEYQKLLESLRLSEASGKLPEASDNMRNLPPNLRVSEASGKFVVLGSFPEFYGYHNRSFYDAWKNLCGNFREVFRELLEASGKFKI